MFWGEPCKCAVGGPFSLRTRLFKSKFPLQSLLPPAVLRRTARWVGGGGGCGLVGGLPSAIWWPNRAATQPTGPLGPANLGHGPAKRPGNACTKISASPTRFCTELQATIVSNQAREGRRNSMWGQETSGAPMSSLGRITIPLDKSFSKKFSNGGIFPVSQLASFRT